MGLGAALAGLIVLGIAMPVPVGAAGASPGAGADRGTTARAIGTQLRLDLYRPGDFVSQTNLVQCVGASMQMMLNIVRQTDDRSADTQRRLFELALALGDHHNPYAGAAHGATAQGWAAGLTEQGAGPYRVVPVADFDAAVSLAARAIERTQRPVGLLVWQGAHAWVMSGFTASIDPLADPTARIAAVRVLDPLYPRPGGTWGPTPVPDAAITVQELSRVFVPYRPHGRTVALRNQFVLVLPVDAPRPAGTMPFPV